MLVLTSMNAWLPGGFIFSMPAFAATAVLIFAAPTAPMAQPRNVVVGNTLSAIVGVALRVLLVDLPGWPSGEFFVAALAVGAAIAVMMAAGSLHPPSAAMAFFAVTNAAAISERWLFIVFPALVSSIIIVLVAALWDNIFAAAARYPAYWFY